ncbi:MAG TPA: hypothetical protein VMK84_35550 [Streptosporangiaceae bacterium]|nr:hypothetical protein [Streptosporangiaceae bacterium]
MIGLYGALGVAVAYGLIELFIRARSVLILIFLAFFIAAGLDPIVGWLVRRRVPQLPALASLIAVLIGGVLLGIVGVLVAIPVAAAIRLLLQEIAFPRLDKS